MHVFGSSERCCWTTSNGFSYFYSKFNSRYLFSIELFLIYSRRLDIEQSLAFDDYAIKCILYHTFSAIHHLGIANERRMNLWRSKWLPNSISNICLFRTNVALWQWISLLELLHPTFFLVLIWKSIKILRITVQKL